MRRLESLDILRGFALCGILFANAPTMLHLTSRHPDGTIDPVATVLHDTVDYRFYPLFSLLFGVSFALLWRSVRTRTTAPRRALRQRLLMLLVLGVLHQLLQPGEALLPYAIFGLIFLLPATLLPERRIPTVIGILGVLALVGGLALNVQLLLVPGLFLLGFALGSTSLPRRLDTAPRLAARPLPLLIPLVALGLLAQHADPEHAGLGVGLLMAATYACLVIAATATPLLGVLRRVFAPLGRTALTNYIAASVILTGVRQVAGPLGLTSGNPTAWIRMLVLCLLILAAQVAVSTWWLSRFDQGPLEKLWRTVTYWRVPARLPETVPA